MSRGSVVRTAAALTAALCFATLSPDSVRAWTPGAGDVDLDGVMTIRDANLIMESLDWPAATRQRLTRLRDACDVNRDGECNATDAYAIYISTITNWGDYDSDGVANAADCAPLDDRIATPHTYFIDNDEDHNGGPERVSECTAAASPPYVPWDGDPNDYLQTAQALPQPRGSRVLAVDLTDLPENGTWRPDLARELGIDATPLKINWGLIETAPGVYNGPQVLALTIASQIYGSMGLKVALSVNPIDRGQLVLPADLRVEVESGRMRLSDPAIASRFRNLLTFIHTSLGELPLVSLQLGYEVDRFLSRTNVPAYFWGDYGTLILSTTQHARSLWGSDLPIGVTATYAGLTAASSQAQMRAINSLVDIVSATYVPADNGIAGTDPADLRVVFQVLIRDAFPKKVHLQAVEYPSAPAAGGSETRQSQLIRAVFDVWDTYAALMPYVSFGRLHDRSPQRTSADAAASIGAPVTGPATLGTVGLRTWKGDGKAKIGYRTLRNQAFERGWWRMEPPATRGFQMGFTPAPYDAPSGTEAQNAALDTVFNHIRDEGSFVNLHFDFGVPWVEAAADNFTSPQAPYSQFLHINWEVNKSRLPAGHTLMVSINPTGVPRDVIAPYFGYGEGFIYNDQFERVGNGEFRDGENRLPPPPWNTYPLDHPMVKLAFTNYCRRVIEHFQPTYLLFAIETSATMNDDPAAYDQLLSLLQHVSSELESRPETRDVRRTVSLSATSFMVDEYGVPLKREEHPALKREMQIQGMFDIAPYVDTISFSFYPHYSKWNSSFMLASMFDELWDLAGRVGKPIGFSESGWPAESFEVLAWPFFGDAEKQARFLRLTFAELHRAPVPVDFYVNFRTRDGDRQWQHMVEWSQQVPPLVSERFVEFYKYFRDIGILDGEGQPRAATPVWRDELARPYEPRH
jgi:hypothetical protein